MTARDFMRKLHMTKEAQVEVEKPKIKEELQKEIIEKVIEEPVVTHDPIPEEKSKQSEVKVLSKEIKNTAQSRKENSTAINQVKRDDVSYDEYGLRPDITNFQLYNYELSEILTSFSRENKKNGGNPITKSQLMETILGFVVYDLKLSADGYSSTQELIEDLKSKIK